MNRVYKKIRELEEVAGFSKHEQLVQGILNSIDEKIVTQGSILPSVNNMVKELGFASKTIVKAYKDLKDRGVIESKNRLGYFVINENTEQKVKVALLIYAFHTFQEDFYNAFRASLGENIQVDVFFHHNNMEIFETIVGNIKGKYGMYVVAPIPNAKTKRILSDFPSNKLLLVDRFEDLGKDFSHITQEFEIATYMGLKELAGSIRKFEEMIFFFLPNSDYPIEVKRAYEQFLKDYNIKGRIEKKYTVGTAKKGCVYFTIGDGDLWRLLKDCEKQGIEVGKDVGILSNNNNIVKEIICGGITTLSTDFEKMGQQAAEFVLNQELVQETIPTILIRRNSL